MSREEIEVDSSSANDGEEEIYEVEEIRDHRIIDGVVKYRVHWKGYSDSEDTWEPLENLEGCQETLNEYYAKLEAKKKEKEKQRAALKAKQKAVSVHLEHEKSSKNEKERTKNYSDSLSSEYSDNPKQIKQKTEISKPKESSRATAPKPTPVDKPKRPVSEVEKRPPPKEPERRKLIQENSVSNRKEPERKKPTYDSDSSNRKEPEKRKIVNETDRKRQANNKKKEEGPEYNPDFYQFYGSIQKPTIKRFLPKKQNRAILYNIDQELYDKFETDPFLDGIEPTGIIDYKKVDNIKVVVAVFSDGSKEYNKDVPLELMIKMFPQLVINYCLKKREMESK
ncbi:hypothetical protein TVAG_340640 [Trichomonas vaginalis G3]|uniref:Chromo domain-containing protein n=1 Tax=Trichomonas vaginalis (strain ATCC PRA-98 / G3) TaxID=412133 RepID=A2DTM3_TRIV3|nr:methylated histone binding [Trichomonas vaginalis G3]EAY16170.1 hypothetical protein TVAG_340640 [Trichomonas vaginalis G3]KAI5493339.1 methylated histone binding [Trichomonas vaginalis G3]|eukprot:XP_001328393.1 hypothetical protein [Trichomonas vaginalis G3]